MNEISACVAIGADRYAGPSLGGLGPRPGPHRLAA